MCGVRTPNTKQLRDFSGVSKEDGSKVLYTYEETPESLKGMSTERFVAWILSLFEGEVRELSKGSALDKEGIDILKETSSRTIGIQVKSSEGGVNHFVNNGSLSEEIIVLWVKPKEKGSRIKLFKWCLNNLPRLKCPLKKDIRELLVKRQKFLEAGMREFKVHRNKTLFFSKREFEILSMLGLAQFDRGTYKI